MEKTNIFQIVVIGIFLFLAVAGVLAFALQKAKVGVKPTELVVWGTLDTKTFENATRNLTEGTSPLFKFNYSYIPEDSFATSIINAFADGFSPDLILYPQNVIYAHRDKVIAIPYESYSERLFKDSFIEAGEVYMSPRGIYALPLTLDPLVMYWNRSLLSNSGYVHPPQYWDEIPGIIEKVTKREGVNIVTATVGLGSFDNIENSKDIFTTLLLQAGNPIVTWRGGNLVPVFAQRDTENPYKAESVVRFFTEFVNPSKTVYTWNAALPSARSMFIAGDLALYLGYASEFMTIQRSNPNLNFDVTTIPQLRDAQRKTFAEVLGVAVVSRSSKRSEALQAALLFSGDELSTSFAQTLHLPPARRNLLASRPAEAAQATFYTASINADSWPDPSPDITYDIFKSLIQNVVSNRLRITEALQGAQKTLETTIR